MIGRPSAMPGIKTATAVDDFWFVWMALVARTKPRNMLPVSPMKIVAGLKLQRKPRIDPRERARAAS